MRLYSERDLKKTYEDVNQHIITKHIIAKYSTNPNDVRDITFSGLDLKKIKNVLDLGCGYGLFVEKLKHLLSPDAVITGLDLLEENRVPFLERVDKAGYSGRFIRGGADIIRDMEKRSFDLVIASYSLYFFPHLIGEISQILKSDGLFITLTHSKSSIQEVIKLIVAAMEKEGIPWQGETALSKLLMAFSLEEGEAQLKRYFNRVEKIVFSNTLEFPLDRIDDCISYLKIKQYLLFKEAFDYSHTKAGQVVENTYEKIYEYAKKNGFFKISKDDAIFRCFNPIGT
jgi:SAM-dependent methyltransferase